MEAAARPRAGVQQTQFAHIGRVVTGEGIFEVAVQRRILTGMLAPRGLALRLFLFDSSGQVAASCDAAYFASAQPLWCEGSRIYLFGFGSWNISGSFEAVEADPRLLKRKGRFRLGDSSGDSVTGNVLDFQRGPTNPILTREKRYGSSGGVDDDPWDLAGPAVGNGESIHD